jgi:hypothetical protein
LSWELIRTAQVAHILKEPAHVQNQDELSLDIRTVRQLLAACSPIRASGVAPTPQVEGVPASQLAPVDYLAVEIGVGSPIPVQVVIDASFPDPCAQLVAAQQSRAGSTFDIEVMTSPADEACASPMGLLPFRFAIPSTRLGCNPAVTP